MSNRRIASSKKQHEMIILFDSKKEVFLEEVQKDGANNKTEKDNFMRYCKQEGITFTRSRLYRKNDNCFVEQKNNMVVRKYVGY